MDNSNEILRIDFKRWLFRLARLWWLILLGIALCLGATHFYLRSVTPLYRASSVILLDVDTGGTLSEASILLGESFQSGGKKFYNQIEIIRSSPLMRQVVDSLELTVGYAMVGDYRVMDLYGRSPVSVDSFQLNTTYADLYVRASGNDRFQLLSGPDDEGGSEISLAGWLPTSFGGVSLSPTSSVPFSPGVYRIRLLSPQAAADQYLGKLEIEQIGDTRNSSLLRLIMVDAVPGRAVDVLSTLAKVYDSTVLSDDNRVLENTLRFIDRRVILLEDELNAVESGIERFRRSNNLINETASTSRGFVVGELRGALSEQVALQTSQELLRSLKSLILNRDSINLLPANLVAENPAISGLVINYNQSVLELERLKIKARAENPARKQLEREIGELRASLLESVRNAERDIDIPLRKLAEKVDKLERNVRSVPAIEKELIERQRLQKVKEELYLALLQKREETSLSLAVAASGNRVVEPARSSSGPVYPNRKLAYLGAAILGLILPSLLITLYYWLDTRIGSEEDVKSITKLPLYGRISKHKSKDFVMIKPQSRSVLAESFRQIRASLSYLSPGEQEKVIAVTSYVSGEGKSFFSINLALTCAMTSDRVVLIELDLRRPRMAEYMGLPPGRQGISSILVGEASIESAAYRVDRLDVITSGPLPPNPAELIESEAMRNLILELSHRYDRIIIDNAPIGLVSDALLLRNVVDRTLLVVRHRYTRRPMLEHIEEMNRKGELPRTGIIMNGVPTSRNSYYGYGKGDGAGYYTEDN